MTLCKELNKEFADKKQMFAALKMNKDEIIALKKQAVKTSDGISLLVKGDTVKTEAGKKLEIGDTIKVVINTTNFLDSHNDLHVDGIWGKSVSEQQGNIFHVINHELALGYIVGYKGDVVMEIASYPWRYLGYDADGVTQALVFNTKMTDKTNKDAFMAYRDGESLQHSVRMSYVSIELAINSEDEYYKDEFATYLKYLPNIVNKEIAEERGYFWVVKEAKISKEGSTVLFGSNEVTPALGINSKESSSTEDAPSKQDTQEQPQKTFSEILATVSFFNN